MSPEQDTGEDAARTPVTGEPGGAPRSIVAGGEDWVLVQLEDADSWDLFTRLPHDREGARLAHITITDRGYISVDATGVRRGPYTTLEEAAYPIWTRSRVLLDDPTTRIDPVPAPSAVPDPPAASARPAAPVRPLLAAVAVVAVGAVVLGVLIGALGRKR
jgi:hypothetical protein